MKSVSLSISDFNPRSPRGGATNRFLLKYVPRMISIHAPHEGERPEPYGISGPTLQFQSTLPTRGSDRRGGSYRGPLNDFNPRSPRGGATCAEQILREREGFQSTLPTRGSDNQQAVYSRCRPNISIHAPHEGERQTGRAENTTRTLDFNPRSPRGGATARRKNKAVLQHISIHAPHEGERLGVLADALTIVAFQSTLPTRGSVD